MKMAARRASVAPAHEQGVWPLVVAGILALAVAMGAGRFAFTPVLPAMRDAFALTPAALGTLASANYLGYLAGALAAATPLLERWQGPVVRGSLLAIVVTTAAMAVTDAFPVWLILRFLAGLASAAVFIFVSASVLERLSRLDRSNLAGWFFSGVGLGIASSGVIVLAIQRLARGEAHPWRLEWLAIAALAAAMSVACWRWLPRPVRSTAAASAPIGTAGWLPLPIILLGAAYFLDGVGYIVAGTFLVAIVAAAPGLSGLGAGAWVLVGIAGMPSTVLWSRIASRIGPLPALAAAYLMQTVGLALPALSDRPWAAALSAILFGATFIAVSSLTLIEARRRAAPHLVARTIGVLTALFGLGQVIGPLLAAIVAGDRGDFRASLLVAAGVVLMGAVLVVAAGKTRVTG
jgi:predicted MFS family arabinose efflux permease